jgi:hypothetical protein
VRVGSAIVVTFLNGDFTVFSLFSFALNGLFLDTQDDFAIDEIRREEDSGKEAFELRVFGASN